MATKIETLYGPQAVALTEQQGVRIYWSDTEFEPGETGRFHEFYPRRSETETFGYALMPCSWGDYVGSTIDRSNHAYLTDQYDGLFVTVTDAYGAESLFVPLGWAHDPEELDRLIADLARLDAYPVLDEDAWSDLEFEMAESAWTGCVFGDLLDLIGDELGGAERLADFGLSLADDEWVYDQVRDLIDHGVTEWVCETATEAVLTDLPRVAEVLAETLVLEWRKPWVSPDQLPLFA